MSSNPSVLIIGAGIAGLSCAVYLKQAGINAHVLDAADSVGGRVRTDVVDGFRLDRGFQILLTAYPEARRLLNYDALDLRPFRSGALIRHNEPGSSTAWLKLLNPLHEPLSVFRTLTSPVGSLADKFRILDLVFQTQRKSISKIFAQTPITTMALLHDMGFSEMMITRFFRPFFGGVFLEDALNTSSNFFEFCFRMFVEGDATVPARGIGGIADQLAARLSPEQIRLNTLVRQIDGTTVRLDSGETLTAPVVVMAVDAAQAARLTNRPAPAPTAFNHTTCTYFAAPQSPNAEKLLILNPRRSAATHNMCVISDVAPDYAPAGQSLISVSTQGMDTIDEAALTARIRRELTDWFGTNGPAGSPAQWRHLRTYHLPQALPAYPPTSLQRESLRLTDTLYQCGDQTAYPSLNAALQTGREVAEAIIW
ncbi:MAG: FAD-dependent oxidoreductase [Spirosoma sp.]|nr:FAD-dependent oxidoreductase [Spirosoma sp.]